MYTKLPYHTVFASIWYHGMSDTCKPIVAAAAETANSPLPPSCRNRMRRPSSVYRIASSRAPRLMRKDLLNGFAREINKPWCLGTSLSGGDNRSTNPNLEWRSKKPKLLSAKVIEFGEFQVQWVAPSNSFQLAETAMFSQQKNGGFSARCWLTRTLWRPTSSMHQSWPRRTLAKQQSQCATSTRALL